MGGEGGGVYICGGSVVCNRQVILSSKEQVKLFGLGVLKQENIMSWGKNEPDFFYTNCSACVCLRGCL